MFKSEKIGTKQKRGIDTSFATFNMKMQHKFMFLRNPTIGIN